ncbi:hypothetical protein [Thermoflexibacter ruber]|uniref:Transglutaminase-like superfamily protein n=1 Tax=Thermoflexibacter ruber TaxID=1003 RepID=A0A1I2JYI6_9BACT|nr:hypothetical protein [Thermoflexibacter ruber]SFF57861.1 hypothetical protein SAMN04488541_106514 [Thermoflexibacter ruber]
MKKALLIALIFSTITKLFGQIPTFQSPQPATLGRYDNVVTFPTQRQNGFPPPNQNNVLQNLLLQQHQQIQLQNQRLINQATQHQQRRTLPQDVLDDIAAFENPKYSSVAEAYNSLNYKFPNVTAKGTNFYESAFAKFQNMLSGKEPLNLKRAVYLVENSYYENTMPYQEFDETLRNIAGLISLKMKQDKMPNNQLAKNLVIYQFMADTFKVKIPHKENQVFTHYPFKYDFEDYRGEKDYRKMFVSKLLLQHSGQCHSMPLLYLLLAEELGAKAWLSYSPNHSFIKFMVNGRLQNYETTNGHFTTDAFALSSGFIKAEALANKVYLDTLSKKQLIAHCLMDLALGYEHKYGYNEFSLKCANLALKHHPQNITALMTKANYYNALLSYVAKQSKEKRLPNIQFGDVPQVYELYNKMKQAQQDLDDIGFAEMPQEAYQNWLKGIQKEAEKSKQTFQNIQQSLWKK